MSTMTGLFAPPWQYAASEDAKNLSRKQNEVCLDLWKSKAISNQQERLISDLEGVVSEASVLGWDGYGAAPVDSDARSFAMQFISALPTTGPLPTLSADPDGEVSFEWDFGKRRALSVSIGRTGRCAFAWISGPNSYRGTDWIENGIPASIVFALRQLDR